MAWYDFIGDILTGGQTAMARETGRGMEAATEEERRYLDMLKGEYAPYLGAGREAVGEYLPAIQAMGDPQAFYSRMMTGYEESPQAQLAREEGLRAMEQGAAASGMTGSGELLRNMLKYGQQLSAADQEQWLKDMMGIYGGYTGGLGQIAGAGQQAAGTYGQLAGAGVTNIADLLAQQGAVKGMGAQALYGIPKDIAEMAMKAAGMSGMTGVPGAGMGGAGGYGSSLMGAAGSPGLLQ